MQKSVCNTAILVFIPVPSATLHREPQFAILGFAGRPAPRRLTLYTLPPFLSSCPISAEP